MSDSFFSSLLGRDMAVDLGTANTLVYVRGRGIVLNEPSVVAVNIKDGRPLAVGLEAKRMIGRTPAHIGAGLPVAEPTGNMVVDIGGGTTEVAVISLGGIVTSQSIRIGGDELDDAIIQHIKKEYSLALGERTSEEIKIALGSAWPLEEELHAEIRGRDLVTGLPKTIVTSTEEVRRAIEEPVSAVVDAVKVTLDKTPPELAADIMEQGIVLTSITVITVDVRGGGSGVLESFRQAARDAFAPIQSATDSVTAPIGDFFGGIFRYGHLKDENARLRRELADARRSSLSARSAE